MSYKITPNYFALKYCNNSFDKMTKLHSISYNKCNFRCGFCNFANRYLEEYIEYSENEFETKVLDLIRTSRFFKFTGGEPTLNRYLCRDLKIVKKYGGYVFLDTNGSKPSAVSDLISDSLIDVIGISIKGTSREEAVSVAKVKNENLAWNNVFETIRIADNHGINTIITMVFYLDIELARIDDFANMLEAYKNVHLKINNLIITEFQ